MSSRQHVSQWEQTVSSSLPHLSRPQAKVLALWSMTMIVVGSCGTTVVGAWLSCTVGGSEESWRQRWREWCYDAQDKKGAQRSERGSDVSVVLRVGSVPSVRRWWREIRCRWGICLRSHGPVRLLMSQRGQASY